MMMKWDRATKSFIQIEKVWVMENGVKKQVFVEVQNNLPKTQKLVEM